MTGLGSGFEGKAALITGGSRGIGFEIARRLRERGGRVAITGRSRDDLERASAEIDGVVPIVADGGDLAGADAVVARVVRELGGLDLLVNNAAMTDRVGEILDLPIETAEAILRVNVLGPLAYARSAWRRAMAEHGGAIVNIGSIAAFPGFGAMGMYGVSKAASLRLTQVLAREFGPKTRVNAVAPGVVTTAFANDLYEGRAEQVASDYPLKRLGEPRDVAEAVLFLLSDAAGWISGETLVVDGGRRQGAKPRGSAG